MTKGQKQIYKRVGGVELHAHVHTPSSAGEGRVGFVFFHGGGFTIGSPLQFAPHCSRLAERGHVAATVEYRLCGSNATHVADQVADAKSAVRWLRANAERLGVDPTRIVAGGGSAGAHLAACTALVDGFDDPDDDLDLSCVPDALVLFNPVIDPRSLPVEHSHIRALFGDDEDSLSLVAQVCPGQPPTVLFQGTDDVLTPVEYARDLWDTMVGCGTTARLLEYPGLGHGFFNAGNDGDKWFEDTMDHVESFVASLWP